MTHLKEIAIDPIAQSYAEFVCDGVLLDEALESIDPDEAIEEAKKQGWSGYEIWTGLRYDKILAAIGAYYHLWECGVYDLKTGERLDVEITGEQIVDYLDWLAHSVSPQVGGARGEIFGLTGVSVYLD